MAAAGGPIGASAWAWEMGHGGSSVPTRCVPSPVLADSVCAVAGLFAVHTERCCRRAPAVAGLLQTCKRDGRETYVINDKVILSSARAQNMRQSFGFRACAVVARVGEGGTRHIGLGCSTVY